MIRILMICHGNICRSTMAEYVMRHLVAQAGCADAIQVDSAAATNDAEGWGVHRGTQKVLAAHGIPCGNHRATPMTRADYQHYDLLIGMDDENLQDIYAILAGKTHGGWSWHVQRVADPAQADPAGKVHLLLDWTDHPREIDDPWYTGDFETTYEDVRAGCEALLAHLRAEGLA